MKYQKSEFWSGHPPGLLKKKITKRFTTYYGSLYDCGITLDNGSNQLANSLTTPITHYLTTFQCSQKVNNSLIPHIKRTPAKTGLLVDISLGTHQDSVVVWFLGFYGILTLVGHLMPNPLYTMIYIIYIGLGLVGFYSISIIVDYLMPNPPYTYILNI